MPSSEFPRGRRVLVPGGTGAVGEGVVRGYLASGADVVVPTRSERRAEEFREILGSAATAKLHLVVHDYTSFDGSASLAAGMTERLGGVDDVIAPIGGWWGRKPLWQIDESDWSNAFTALSTAHMAIARAVLPRLSAGGTYQVIVGESAVTPVPGSGLVSMEQAAILMMSRVLATEANGGQRVFALMLGLVGTRINPGEAELVSAEQIGRVAVALSATPAAGSRELHLGNGAEAETVLADLNALTR
jgi:NAD(P)-dependent dehydrogenase (short-subunit alcohol dehydrogenase family)